MELRHLRYFCAVAELLNFSRAGEKLRVAQPALSRQIRDLEDELGARLFDRNRVRVQLTDAGRVFYLRVCRILSQVDMAATAVHEASRGKGGELILCHDWRISNEMLSETLFEFRTKFPRVEITLRDIPMSDQIAALRGRRAHIGFIPRGEVGRSANLESMPVFNSGMILAVNRNHRVARRQSVRIDELKDETWLRIADPNARGFHQVFSKVCRSTGFEPKFGKQADGLGGLLSFVAAGYGVTLLPETISTAPDRFVRFLRTDFPPIEMCAVWHRRDNSMLLRAYLEMLRGHVSESAPAA